MLEIDVLSLKLLKMSQKRFYPLYMSFWWISNGINRISTGIKFAFLSSSIYQAGSITN